MNTETISCWVKGIGRTYDELIAEKVIPNLPIMRLYEGSEWLTMTPHAGLELIFWADTRRLEKVLIVFSPRSKETLSTLLNFHLPFRPEWINPLSARYSASLWIPKDQ